MIRHGISSPDELYIHARRASETIMPRGVPECISLLLETNKAETTSESKFSHDRLGCMQIDRFDFKNTQHRMLSHPATLQNILTYAGVNLGKVKFEQLEYAPFLSFLVAACRYGLVESKIPSTIEGRASFWKDWFRSDGSTSHYLKVNGVYYDQS